MKILIYGAGSVGLGIASCLFKFGSGIDVVARQETVDSLHLNGLVRTGIFGDSEALTLKVNFLDGLR